MNFFKIPALNDLFVNSFNKINETVFGLFPDKNISYGLSIIILTIIIRLLLVPLYVKQIKSTAGMGKIGPEVKKLQAKHKNDPQKLNAETMKLYKEHGVNPFGGCLPALIQMPILFALYYVFSTLNIKGIGFLWMHDLSKSATLSDWTSWILPIISGGTTFISGMLMSVNADKAQAKQTATMNIVMSIMLFWMSINFSSALVLYWVTGNIVQIIQSKIILNLVSGNSKKEQDEKLDKSVKKEEISDAADSKIKKRNKKK